MLPAVNWSLSLATNASKSASSPGIGDGSGVIPEGQRNEVLTSIAGAARRRGTSREGIEAALLVENSRCSPPLSNDEVKKIAESVSRYEPVLKVRPIRSASSGIELLRSENGAARGCIANVVTLLRESPEWRGVIGYNEFAGRVELRKPAPGFPDDPRPCPRECSDADDVFTTGWIQRAGVMVNSVNVVSQAIQAVAREKQNRFHPVLEYLESPTWDGTERADHWLTNYFNVVNSDYVRAVARRWLISACARAFSPGCQVDHTLLLIGRQGVGKSSGIRALVPYPEWFADAVDTLGSRDARLGLWGKFLIELSELSALRRAEVEAVKSFLSERNDHYRPPYGRHAIDVPRQCVFAGTTNDESPLLDSENRRFWPVRVGKVDVTTIEQNRDQLWAEAVFYYKRSDPWWLDTSALTQAATEAQKNAYSPGPWDEQIFDWIQNPESRPGVEPWFGSRANWINLTDALLHCVGLETSRIQLKDRQTVSRYLKHLGYSERQEGKLGPYRGKRYYAKGAE